MYCYKCGTKNSDTARFCKMCGTQLYQDDNNLQEAGPRSVNPNSFDHSMDSTLVLNASPQTEKVEKHNRTPMIIAEIAVAVVAVAVITAIALFLFSSSTGKENKLEEKGLNSQADTVEIGDTFVFGTYEQDGDDSNGTEDIEWLVLDKQDGKILVISKYALDRQEYNTSDTDVTWENCSLRSWLNDTFLNTAFTGKEAAKIVATTVTADQNPEYDINAGNDTQDQIFLLSIKEVEKYFSSDSARQCEATAYAQEQGVWIGNSSGNCFWWLRTPGYLSACAAGVDYDGSVIYRGINVDHGDDSVRPAMWIKLKS